MSAPTLHSGWYLVAFTGELTGDVTPTSIGDRPLVIVHDVAAGAPPRIFDAVCPHRGADLGYGATLAEGSLVCPFHGKAIALGDDGAKRLCVAEVRTLVAGELVFACLDPAAEHDVGFVDAIASLGETHRFVAGISRPVAAPQEVVIENAFDIEHFAAVHHVPRAVSRGLGFTPTGAAWVDAGFRVPTLQWEAERESPDSSFGARAFSPSIVLSTVGSTDDATVVITGATAAPGGAGSVVRVGYAVSAAIDPTDDAASGLSALKEYSLKSLAQDSVVWEHLRPPASPVIGRGDEAVELFRAFCARFRDVAAEVAS